MHHSWWGDSLGVQSTITICRSPTKPSGNRTTMPERVLVTAAHCCASSFSSRLRNLDVMPNNESRTGAGVGVLAGSTRGLLFPLQVLQFNGPCAMLQHALGSLSRLVAGTSGPASELR